MSRILVLGASGMFGHKLCQELPKRGHEVIGTTRAPFRALQLLSQKVRLEVGVDAADVQSIRKVLREYSPQFVINTIGIVKQKETTADKSEVVTANAWLPHILDQDCTRMGAKLIHISTDCVFSGRRGAYKEDDNVDPCDLYGISKYLGEPNSTQTATVTIRSSMIGRELRRPTYSLLEWFLAQRGQAVKGFAKAIFSGFTTIEMARVIALIVEKHPELRGVYHVASTPISKYDLLHMIRRELQLNIDIRRDEQFVCDRSLDMRSFADKTGYLAPSWSEMIKEMCADSTPYDTLQTERQ